MENFLDSLNIPVNIEGIKGIIEAVLYAAGDALSVRELAEITGVEEKQIKLLITEMNKAYEADSRGIFIVEFNNKVQLSTKPELGTYIKKMLKPGTRQTLSQAALETLSIIAYKQPVTRMQIDEIRGVRSDRAISTLIESQLVKETGRLDAPGRPILYGTTDDFLKYFGFKSIKELPQLIEFNLENEEE